MKIDGNTPITLNLTLDTLNVALGALSSQPYDRVAGLIQSLQQQAGAQIAAYQAQDEGKQTDLTLDPPANDSGPQAPIEQ